MTVWRSVLKAIAVLAAAGPLWFLIGLCPIVRGRTAAGSGPAGVDPARAAREVFQDQDFWWKRIETPDGLELLARVHPRGDLDFFGRDVPGNLEWLARS